MKEKEYRITIHSIARFIIATAIILCSSLILIDTYIPRIENEFISIIQFLAVFISSIYLGHLIGMAKIKILLNEEGITHIWERRFLLSRDRNFKITWDKVDNYVFEEDRTADRFIINLKSEIRYKIDRLNIIPINDDFNKLIQDFPKLSNEFKDAKDPNSKLKIKEGEIIYASKAFKWIIFFILAGFLILLVGKILNPESDTRWGSIGVIGCGLLFYTTMIKEKKKK